MWHGDESHFVLMAEHGFAFVERRDEAFALPQEVNTNRFYVNSSVYLLSLGCFYGDIQHSFGSRISGCESKTFDSGATFYYFSVNPPSYFCSIEVGAVTSHGGYNPLVCSRVFRNHT